MLDQYESQGLLALNNGNYRTGSGGLGFTDDLPSTGSNSKEITSKNLWGSCAEQMLSDVSEDMFEEFALQYDMKWLKRFGLNYYGCCEPLDDRIELLRKIPNLRKISISPWANLENAVTNIGKDFVISFKLNTEVLIFDKWDTDSIRKKIVENYKIVKNCAAEFIIKDVSTVNYEPQRLWDITEIALEEARKLEE